MRFFCIFLLLLTFINADEIKEKSKNLKENERIANQLNKKLEDLAKDILSSEKNLANLATQIEKLNTETSRLSQSAKVQNQELANLSSQNKNLLKNKNDIESKLINLIAKDFAYELALPSGYIESEESFIAFEVLNTLDAVLKEDFYKLSKDYEDISKLIDDKQKQINVINNNLKEYNSQIAKLEELKKKQVEEINKQKTDRSIYTKKLSDLQKQQVELRKTLATLKITDENKEQQINKNSSSNQRIRQLGSSYQGSLVKRYTGKKTIAPLDNFSVKQKFGNYIDPVYNIKLFNENVVLRSKSSDATVKSVLAGKVVFAKETNLLQKVVIVEHSNGIHTIYAHLDKIAPTVKVGKNVKKSEVLGRVKNDLTFEVTQEKFHINPLELISLN
ncbi:peptidase M23 [Campylobacter sp. MIT 99-7217]|uniref:murein hydrolase activator EnvC family protein n=1 Tax=Campylobacter sp. MIT 99-7217 TaxID=535091 RepID=UPI001159F564|nr:M23 family metallopeptidase [Campylobacter sp. MIT 99-7217]TQR33774.1 peptidase M23 [Campylobacter sp. MIT 99-7217]